MRNRKSLSLAFLISIALHGAIIFFLWYFFAHSSESTATHITPLVVESLASPQQQQPAKKSNYLDNSEANHSKKISETESAPVAAPEGSEVQGLYDAASTNRDSGLVAEGAEPLIVTLATTTAFSDKEGSSAKNLTDLSAKDSVHIKSIQQRYIQEIMTQLNAHRFYPPSAKRMGQEGTVLIYCVVSKSGEISSLAITKKSAFEILNNAALQTIKNCGRFNPIPNELGVTTLELTLPIHYSLSDK